MRNLIGELRKMSSIARAQMLVREIGGNDDNAKERIRRAAIRLQAFTYSRVRDLYRGEKRCRVSLDEFTELERVAELYRKTSDPAAEAKNEFREFQDRLARIEEALRIQDEEFHSSARLALRGPAGDLDRAMDKGDLD